MKTKWPLWIPAFVVLGFIIFFNFQSPVSTIRQTQVVQKHLVNITLAVNKDAVNSTWILNKQIIRKGAHFIEYFCLGSCVSIAAMATIRLKHKIGCSILLCCIISICDQILKIFLPTREFDCVDLIIDFGGYFVGVLVATLLYEGLKRLRGSKDSGIE